MDLILFNLILSIASAQYYCWPCATRHGVVGKYTAAASDPGAAYNWSMRYINNVRGFDQDTGIGYRSYYNSNIKSDIIEGWDVEPNVLALRKA